MKAKLVFALIPGMVVVVAAIAIFRSRTPPAVPEPKQPDASVSQPADLPAQPAAPESAPSSPPIAPATVKSATLANRVEEPVVATNKLERLAQVRETFQALARGEPAAALRAAKKIGDETERETALLSLVTEWTQGELSPPRARARAITMYGLEVGLGMELAKDPGLAVLWANELTDGEGRTALLQQTAVALTASDPAAAFAMGDQVPEAERRKFFDEVYAGWAFKDTEAALQWAGQLSDATERDSAMQAIHNVAPVGIGAALMTRDGFPVLNQLLPGSPADLSGQLHSGDRIVALSQGGDAFVQTRDLSLRDVVQMIRGAPGSQLVLQVLSADAPADSPPRTVSIIRDQIKYKR